MTQLPAPLEEQPSPSLFDRTLENLRSAWRDIAAFSREAVGAMPRPHLPREDADRLRVQMQACLAGRGGEVSARARAAELGRTYLSLDSTGRRNFLTILSRDFDVDRATVDQAVDAFHKAPDPVLRGKAERKLREALEPGRMRLLTQFNGLPEGVKFLVDMRAQLLEWAADDPLMAADQFFSLRSSVGGRFSRRLPRPARLPAPHPLYSGTSGASSASSASRSAACSRWQRAWRTRRSACKSGSCTYADR